ncbi:MAG: hypothetical protein M5U30_07220 [Burkholderiaceae bacterium]|nr:hypothetical protein [Burkholderiaceae bacterium]
MKIFGYLDVWCAAPGQQVTAHLASEQPGVASVDLVALGRGEERADADGIRFGREPSVAEQDVFLDWQQTDAGSCALIEGMERPVPIPGTGVLVLYCQPWSATSGDSVIFSNGGSDGTVAIGIDACWRPFVAIGGRRTTCNIQLAKRRWYMLALEWRANEFDVTLVVATDRGQALDNVQIRRTGAAPVFDNRLPIVLAGRMHPGGSIGDHFNGRIERPAILGGQVGLPSIARWVLEEVAPPPGELFACWDFARRVPSREIEDVGPHGMHGRLLNAPKRAVRGVRWSGRRFDWTSCPEEYAAIHFHDDDLDDARWMPSLSLQIPADLASGAYALRVCRDGETLLLPLFVRAAEPGRRARVAVVFPTYTYRPIPTTIPCFTATTARCSRRVPSPLEPRDVAMARHPEWGLSLYDTHRDGSGVSVASRRRPVLTFAPDQRAWQGAEGSGRWNYSADLVMVEWLHREGIAWEALTDEDIDREGERVLRAYEVVLTGSHPEYATPNMLAAYRAFAAGRGRLMYLGGNGFYWKVATDPARPGLIELRRAEDGNRSWAEEPCEYYHQLDGQYGGLWRRSGVAPQSWLGVGYSGQGFRRSVGYRRGADSERAEVAFVFDGVAGSDFGTRGAFGGGCAGIEIDRADELLGSPREGYLLASSHPFDDTYFMANEELLVTRPTVSGDYSSTVRSDVFLLATEGGGAVFSVGSVAWIGGLSANCGDAAVIRITRNVLDRFLDPTPLPVRDGPYEC